MATTVVLPQALPGIMRAISLDLESATAIESLIHSLKTSHAILLVKHMHEQAEKVSDSLIFCNIIK
jgi:ABC-type phosphate transport system ATPase subunit